MKFFQTKKDSFKKQILILVSEDKSIAVKIYFTIYKVFESDNVLTLGGKKCFTKN